MKQQMTKLLQEAYQHPKRGHVYFAGRQPPASKRLCDLPAWDWTPAFSQPISGVWPGLFALDLGCEAVFTNKGQEWCRPVIHSPQDVDELEIPDVQSERCGAVFADVKRQLETLDPEAVLRLPGIPSPFSIAEIMWDGNFYFALVETPEAVHELLDKVTRFLIDFIKELQHLAGPQLNAAGLSPLWSDHNGCTIIDDSLSLASPGILLSYHVPYLNQITKACGPLFYHAGSWREPYFESIRKLRKVKALSWDVGNSADPTMILRKFGGDCLLAPELSANLHLDSEILKLERGFRDEADLLRYVLGQLDDHTSMYWRLGDVTRNGPLIERIYDVFDEFGCTPKARGLF